MIVYAIQQFRTDTTKDGSEQILVPMYQHRNKAEKVRNDMRDTEKSDVYSVTGYRVIEINIIE